MAAIRTLVYRRTHKDDPDARGCFGIHDCMGEVRDRNFNAVIGVGGISYEARCNGIDGKVNWIGIGAHKHKAPPDYRGSLVTFDHFLLFEEDGPDFAKLAPILAERIYSTLGQASFVNFTEDEQAEIDRILKLARNAPPSSWTEDDVPKKPKCQPPDYQRRCRS